MSAWACGARTLMLLALATLPLSAGTLASFGVVADIQYAHKTNADGRSYGGSLDRLAQCATNFNATPLAFVIQLGDIIDGYPSDLKRSQEDLAAVAAVYGGITHPRYSALGNHCVNAGTGAIQRALGVGQWHHEFTVPAAPGWRFIVLDGTEAGYGVMSTGQVAWFSAALARAAAHGERVICFCHFALLKEAAQDWRMTQPEQVLEAIGRAGCVAAWFAGHEHAGGYVYTSGVHHVTFKAMVENTTATYAVVTLHNDRIVITGSGGETSRELTLAPLPARASSLTEPRL